MKCCLEGDYLFSITLGYNVRVIETKWKTSSTSSLANYYRIDRDVRSPITDLIF